MTTLFIKPDNIKLKVPIGINLRQVAMMTGASMDFECNDGECGKCIATIDQGMELLNKVTSKETVLMETLDQESDNLRLMCQCIIDNQEGEIVISY
jgi:ferredoxin